MVLFVSYSGVYGGAERQLVEIATALEPECCVACPEGPLAVASRAVGLRVFPLRWRTLHIRLTVRDRLRAIPHLIGHGREMRALTLRLDPDLVIGWGMRSAIGWLVGRPRGRRFVFQHNDLLPGRLIAALVRAAAARADLVLAVSRTVARDLDPPGRLAARLLVIHPGIDIAGFEPGGPPREPAEVVVIGALVAWKRPDLALEAFALVRAQQPNARLRFVGAPLERGHELYESLQARARRPDLIGGVEFAGEAADVRDSLRRCTCLLHCAEREPFGLAVLEALAIGRPAVVPASGGPAEIVDRASALTYPAGDARAAADAVLELLSNRERAASMGERGRARARRFDRAAGHAAYAAAVAPLLRPRRGGRLAPRELAIVTVTHNSAAELAALLGSVDRHVPGAQVIVADSGSGDDSVAVARAWAGRASVVTLSDNVGFGRACNRALIEARAPVTVLLNPDVELVDDSLLELAGEAARPGAPERLLAPLVLAPDGSRQDSVHPAPGSRAELVHALVPPAALPGRAAVAIAPWRADAPREVGWAVGCALAARTETLRRLGPFDDRLFLYGEDLDLALRARAAGIRTWFWPAARVIHRGAHASSAAFGGEPFERLARARREVVGRRLGRGRLRVDDATQAATFASRATLKRLLGRSAARELEQLAALRSARSKAGT